MKATWLTGAFLALFLMSGCGAQAEKTPAPAETASAEAGALQEGQTPPSFSLKDLGGQDVKIDFANDKKLYVINFWATWCPPCREEMPELDAFAKKHAEDVAFYAINLQEPGDKVESFFKQNNYTMPVLLDLEGKVADQYEIRAIPTTYIVGKDGKIVMQKLGGTTAAELEAALAKAAK